MRRVAADMRGSAPHDRVCEVSSGAALYGLGGGRLAWGNPGFPHGPLPSALSLTARPWPPAGQSPAPAAAATHPRVVHRRGPSRLHADALHAVPARHAEAVRRAAAIDELALVELTLGATTGRSPRRNAVRAQEQSSIGAATKTCHNVTEFAGPRRSSPSAYRADEFGNVWRS